jgi:hypothetical protein
MADRTRVTLLHIANTSPTIYMFLFDSVPRPTMKEVSGKWHPLDLGQAVRSSPMQKCILSAFHFSLQYFLTLRSPQAA